MDIDDICKYIGYIVAGILLLYLGLKSIRFQYKCVEGFVKKKPSEKEKPIEKEMQKTEPITSD